MPPRSPPVGRNPRRRAAQSTVSQAPYLGCSIRRGKRDTGSKRLCDPGPAALIPLSIKPVAGPSPDHADGTQHGLKVIFCVRGAMGVPSGMLRRMAVKVRNAPNC
jgi:hypothetical protein